MVVNRKIIKIISGCIPSCVYKISRIKFEGLGVGLPSWMLMVEMLGSWTRNLYLGGPISLPLHHEVPRSFSIKIKGISPKHHILRFGKFQTRLQQTFRFIICDTFMYNPFKKYIIIHVAKNDFHLMINNNLLKDLSTKKEEILWWKIK